MINAKKLAAMKRTSKNPNGLQGTFPVAPNAFEAGNTEVLVLNPVFGRVRLRANTGAQRSILSEAVRLANNAIAGKGKLPEVTVDGRGNATFEGQPCGNVRQAYGQSPRNMSTKTVGDTTYDVPANFVNAGSVNIVHPDPNSQQLVLTDNGRLFMDQVWSAHEAEDTQQLELLVEYLTVIYPDDFKVTKAGANPITDIGEAIEAELAQAIDPAYSVAATANEPAADFTVSFG